MLPGSDSKSESDSTTDGEMATSFPHDDADKLGFEKSEEAYGDWKKYWNAVIEQKKTGGLLDITQGLIFMFIESVIKYVGLT